MKKHFFTKPNIHKFITHPSTTLFTSCLLCGFTLTLLLTFISQNPYVTDNENFILGARFGCVLFIFLYSLLNIPFCFFALVRYVQKHHIGGDNND